MLDFKLNYCTRSNRIIFAALPDTGTLLKKVVWDLLSQVTNEGVEGRPTERIYEFSVIKHPDKFVPVLVTPGLQWTA
jgi:hypothetical protein